MGVGCRHVTLPRHVCGPAACQLLYSNVSRCQSFQHQSMFYMGSDAEGAIIKTMWSPQKQHVNVDLLGGTRQAILYATHTAGK